METSIQIQSHIGKDGTLHIEGLHEIADQDVIIILAPEPAVETPTSPFDLTRYAAPLVGAIIAERLKQISHACASLPILDDRSPEEILGYNDIGLP